jgi:hypothetical protein
LGAEAIGATVTSSEGINLEKAKLADYQAKLDQINVRIAELEAQ